MASTYCSSGSDNGNANMETESSSHLHPANGHGQYNGPALTADAIVSDLGAFSPYDRALSYESAAAAAAAEEYTKEEPHMFSTNATKYNRTIRGKEEEEQPDMLPTLNTRENDNRPIWALLNAYGSLSTATLLDLLAPNFTHRVLPESLDMPTRDKSAFAQHAEGIFSIFESFHLEPKEVLKIDSCRDKWVVYTHMEGVLKGGKGEWKNECIMIVKMDQGRKLVEEIQEFVDSAKAVEMIRKHAPKDFGGGAKGGGAQQTTAAPVGRVDVFPRTTFLTTFCWFLFCVLLAKMGAEVLALGVFWAHPQLDAFRRSFSLAPRP